MIGYVQRQVFHAFNWVLRKKILSFLLPKPGLVARFPEYPRAVALHECEPVNAGVVGWVRDLPLGRREPARMVICCSMLLLCEFRL